jgi:hypothetical protein
MLFRTTTENRFPVLGLVVTAVYVLLYSGPDTGDLALPHFGGARKDCLDQCGLILGIIFYL